MLFRNIGRKILDSLYPRHCPICNDIVARKNTKACQSCVEKLSIVKEPRCKKCSKPLEGSETEYCFDCQHKSHYFDEGYAILLYDETMQRSMAYFKFHGRQEYGDFYSELLLKAAHRIVKRWQVEVLLPVPSHRQRINKRGYNQTEIIGRALSKGLSIPIRTNLIRRVKNTKAQKKLNIDERKKNVKNAFVVSEKASDYHRVLIIDDIYTTGSTVDEMAKELRKRGVKKVFFLTVCIGGGF